VSMEILRKRRRARKGIRRTHRRRGSDGVTVCNIDSFCYSKRRTPVSETASYGIWAQAYDSTFTRRRGFYIDLEVPLA
jgi:hypothetical protein